MSEDIEGKTCKTHCRGRGRWMGMSAHHGEGGLQGGGVPQPRRTYFALPRLSPEVTRVLQLVKDISLNSEKNVASYFMKLLMEFGIILIDGIH